MIRPATAADGPALAGLEAAFPARQRWSEAAWLQEIEAADRLVEVADQSGVAGAATWRLVDDVADLHRIVVAPGHRRTGLAVMLMDHGLAWATERGAARVLLEVEADNAPAVALYRRFGFTEISRRDNYYGAGVHALIMELEIP